MENEKKLIDQIVRSFYKEAVNDVFIGYHFRKLIKDDNYNNINNDLGPFVSHIPKVIDFWSEQLISEFKPQEKRENVLKVHSWLNIRKGELGRWLTIFNEHLNKFRNESNEDLIKRWELKLKLFEIAFLKKFF